MLTTRPTKPSIDQRVLIYTILLLVRKYPALLEDRYIYHTYINALYVVAALVFSSDALWEVRTSACLQSVP